MKNINNHLTIDQMKKLLIVFSAVMLLATGCAKTAKEETASKELPSVDQAPIVSEEEEPNNWKLVSGMLPYADPDPIVFHGNATLKGWGVSLPYYTGTPELLFHAAPESIKNLPKEIDFKKTDWNFKLKNANSDFVKILSESTQQNQVEVLVDKLTVVQEGRPFLHLTETAGNSPLQK